MKKEKLHIQSETWGNRFDKEGNILKEFNKKKESHFDLNEISEDNKIAIDSMMMTLAIQREDFKRLLIQNIWEDFPYTTGMCKKETIYNLVKLLKIPYKEAKNKFSILEKELNLKYLQYKPEYYIEADEFFKKVISNMKIKKIKTFRNDCINVIILKKNNVSEFFSNDEDLKKACKRFNMKIKFTQIEDSSEKVIKNWKQRTYPKGFKYQKKGRRGRR